LTGRTPVLPLKKGHVNLHITTFNRHSLHASF